jgi:hypothetical protein
MNLFHIWTTFPFPCSHSIIDLYQLICSVQQAYSKRYVLNTHILSSFYFKHRLLYVSMPHNYTKLQRFADCKFQMNSLRCLMSFLSNRLMCLLMLQNLGIFWWIKVTMMTSDCTSLNLQILRHVSRNRAHHDENWQLYFFLPDFSNIMALLWIAKKVFVVK